MRTPMRARLGHSGNIARRFGCGNTVKKCVFPPCSLLSTCSCLVLACAGCVLNVFSLCSRCVPDVFAVLHSLCVRRRWGCGGDAVAVWWGRDWGMNGDGAGPGAPVHYGSTSEHLYASIHIGHASMGAPVREPHYGEHLRGLTAAHLPSRDHKKGLAASRTHSNAKLVA